MEVRIRYIRHINHPQDSACVSHFKTEAKDVGLLDETSTASPWPPHCCMPAFLLRAVAASSRLPIDFLSSAIRLRAAQAIGVTVPLSADNPWHLPTSSDPMDWGVRVAYVEARFGDFCRAVGVFDELAFQVWPMISIAFEQYEDAALELIREGAVVAIAFDYDHLFDHDRAVPATSRHHHIVRLSPLDSEVRGPTVLSSEFKFDYNGQVRVFDDSGEIPAAESVVSWRSLLRASR